MHLRRRLVLVFTGLLLLATSPAQAQNELRPGDLLVTKGSQLLRVEPTSGRSWPIVIDGGPAIAPVGFDAAGALIGGRFSRIELPSGRYAVIRSPGQNQRYGDAAIGPDGALWSVNTTEPNDAIERVDPVTGVLTVVVSGLTTSEQDLGGIAVEPEGTVLVARRERSLGITYGSILRIDPGSGAYSAVVTSPDLPYIDRMTLDPQGRLLILDRTASGQSRLVRMDRSTGAYTVLTQGDKLGAWDIATDAAGGIYVSDVSSVGVPRRGPQIVRVDPVDGAQRVVFRGPGLEFTGVAVVPGMPAPPECSNGRDDDGDGRTDHPADDGCFAARDGTEQPSCADGIDNDADGAADFPLDAGCASAEPWAQETPQCQNGIDDDGDGYFDFPEDPECALPSWNFEHFGPGLPEPPPVPSCGLVGAEAWAAFGMLRTASAWRRRRSR